MLRMYAKIEMRENQLPPFQFSSAAFEQGHISLTQINLSSKVQGRFYFEQLSTVAISDPLI